MSRARTFTVRAATPADAPAVAEVHVEGWRWGYRGLLPEATIEANRVEDRERFWTATLREAAPRSVCLVAEDADRRVAGFVACGPADQEPVAAPVDAGEVYALYLREDARGTGVGRALLGAACEAMRAAGFPRAVLWVLETNDLARRFYEVAGWRPDGARSAHRFECGERPILRYAAELGRS